MIIQSDVSRKEFLLKTGFILVGKIKDLIERGFPAMPELNSSGLYSIVCSEDFNPAFYTPEYIKKKKNVISPWPEEKLKNKWISRSEILYYGIAGAHSPRSLKKRLNDLLNHCCGKTTDRGPHKGGEIIWQLQGYENFEIWILPVPFEQSPRLLENDLLKNFYLKKGCLPFANRQF